MFDHVGEIVYRAEAGSGDAVMEAAIEAGADDVESGADGHVVYASFESFGDVAKALEDRIGEAESVKAIWRPQNLVPLDEEKAATLLKLIDTLEDDDDVQAVYTNFDVSEDVLQKLTAA
jgi:transcriptional/translational regulatory protein YebC/TACO1